MPSGYRQCACRDCFEIVVGKPGEYCQECLDAGCHEQPRAPNRECLSPTAYGGTEEEGEDEQ